MSKNINQIFVANPAASMAATDLFYLGRSPYGATDDMAITWSNVMASITTVGTISSGTWNGSVIAMQYGGTSKNLTANNGGIVWTDADSMEVLAGTATAGKMLQSGATATPSWSTPTWPSASGTTGQVIRSNGTNNVYSTSTFADTYAISTILYASAANVVTGLATTNRAAFATTAGGVPQWLAMTDGQVIIGSTAGAPAAANLAAGSGISISSGSNTITISGTGSGIGWTEITGATQAMVADNGYVANRGTLITFTLPATAAFGTVINVVGKGAGGWLIAQNAGQNIQIGSLSSTVGAGGSVASSNQFDSLELLCTTANTTWTTIGAPQSALLTIV